MSKTYRLVYCSANRLAGTSNGLEAEILKILDVARVNNARNEVTGALIFNAGSFGQVLEGPRARVEETFERIQQDERHGNVTLLDFSAVQDRVFGHWRMAYAGSSERTARQFAALTGRDGLDPRTLRADVLHQALHALVIGRESGAA